MKILSVLQFTEKRVDRRTVWQGKCNAFKNDLAKGERQEEQQHRRHISLLKFMVRNNLHILIAD